ncbi:MAG TPA: type IV pilus secretin PilQ [Dissulfurispiraceae bacterium]|nr:type IV pilus secretin PilQ [Dissulfurispiraceae bacterium]
MNSIISEIDLKERKRMQNRALNTILSFLLLFVFCGAIGTAWAAGTAEQGSSVVRDISIVDNTIKVKIDGPIKYSISKPSDPFTVVVDISGASLGQFKNKIISTVPSISEIVPTQIEVPNYTARLTILLQSPAEVSGDVRGDELVLSLDKAADAEASGQAVKQAAAKKDTLAKAITDVAFDKDGETNELIIKADGKLLEPVVYQVDNSLSVEIPGVAMKASMPSKLPSVMKDLRVRTGADKLKFDIVLADKMTSEVYVLDDEVVIDVIAKAKKGKKKSAPEVRVAPPKEKIANGSKVISLDFQDADIVPILRLLGDVGGYNMVVHPDVKGKITMKLMNVPWNQALDIILKTFNLEKVVEGNIIRVATVKAFQEEKKAVAENKELFGKAEDIETRIFTVNYASVDDIVEHDEITKQDRKIPGIKDLIEKGKILSPRGTISVDSRTRTIIVKDIASSIEEVQKLLNVLDKPTRQVLIEARIVEMNNDYVKSLGVDWGLTAFSHATLPHSIAMAGGSSGAAVSNVPGGGLDVINKTDLSKVGTINIPGAINLPATTSTIINPTSAVTFGFLNRAQTFGLDLRLSAIQDTGQARIVSSPKILTLDNRSAVIKQGKKIPVTTPQSGSGGGSTTFTTVYIDANLKLTVTPQIAPDNSIQLRVEVNKDQPDFTNKDIFGNPAIDIKQALTQVMLNDGETIVMGGIYTSNETTDDSEVPGLGKVPVLGWLFKKNTVEKHSTELLIFVTPRIAQ